MGVSSNTCRLCLLGNAVVKIFENRKSNILEMIKKCCQFEIIEADNLPQKLCLKCLNTLKICHEFILQCLENNEKLLQQNKIKTDSDIIKIEHKYLIKCEFDNELDVEIYGDNPKESYFDNEDQIDDIKPIINKEQIKNKNTTRSRRNVRNKTNSGNRKDVKENDMNDESTKVLNPPKQLIKPSDKILNNSREEKTDRILCDFCGKAVKRGNMKGHRLIHSTERKFGCKLCSSTFKLQCNLLRHIKNVHTYNKVTCDVCKKAYNNKNALKAHLETVHTTERKFACDRCPKKFKRKAFLQLHMITHTQERAFNCRFCDSTFTLKKTKIEHERLHMGITPYKCPSCHKAFTQLSNMKSHFKHNHKDIVFSEVYQAAPRGRKTLSQNTDAVPTTVIV